MLSCKKYFDIKKTQHHFQKLNIIFIVGSNISSFRAKFFKDVWYIVRRSWYKRKKICIPKFMGYHNKVFGYYCNDSWWWQRSCASSTYSSATGYYWLLIVQYNFVVLRLFIIISFYLSFLYNFRFVLFTNCCDFACLFQAQILFSHFICSEKWLQVSQ